MPTPTNICKKCGFEIHNIESSIKRLEKAGVNGKGTCKKLNDSYNRLVKARECKHEKNPALERTGMTIF